jgi:hypothetical protein
VKQGYEADHQASPPNPPPSPSSKMSTAVFDSSPPTSSRHAIFQHDSDDSGDSLHGDESVPFLSSHLPSSSPVVTPSMSLLSEHNATSPSYASPTTARPRVARNSFGTDDPWLTTPRSNGTVPVAVPNFPRQAAFLNQAPGETASYLLDADHVTLKKVDEKEGLLGFKHVNYTLASARRGTQVTRRYSDFAW